MAGRPRNRHSHPDRNGMVMTDPQTICRLTWQHGPVLTLTDQHTQLEYRPTPAQTAALIKRLATYLATWHRNDVDLTGHDPDTDPDWQPPPNTESDQTHEL